MVNKFIIIALLLLVVPLMSAADTPIKITTLPYHNVEVVVHQDTNEAFSLLERMKDKSNYFGEAEFVFSSSATSFRVMVFIKRGTETVFSEKYTDSFSAGESIELEFLPEDYVLPKKEDISSKNNTEETLEELDQELNQTDVADLEDLDENLEGTGEESFFDLTGFTVFGEDGIISQKTSYYVGGVLGFFLIIAILFFITKRRISREPKEIKVKKLSELKKDEVANQEPKQEPKKESPELLSAEEKLKELENEIEDLKKKGKLKEIEEEIQRKQRELENLREKENL